MNMSIELVSYACTKVLKAVKHLTTGSSDAASGALFSPPDAPPQAPKLLPLHTQPQIFSDELGASIILSAAARCLQQANLSSSAQLFTASPPATARGRHRHRHSRLRHHEDGWGIF